MSRAGAVAILAFGLLLAVVPVRALAPDTRLSQCMHRSWNTADGLPSGGLMSLAQDSDGYMWIGTQGGIVRFDGVRFTVYDSTNTPEIHNDFIMAICPSLSGGVWIGTFGGGLLRCDADVFALWTKTNGLPSMQIRSLLEDRSHNLWIGTDGGGLAVMKDGLIKVYTTRDGLPGNRVWSLAEGPDGALWIGTDRHGVCRFENGKFTTITTKDGLPSNGIRSLCADTIGNMWIGTSGAGLACYRGGKITLYGTKEGLPGMTVSSLLLDKTGMLWVGTEEGGLARFQKGAFETFTSRQGLANNLVQSLAEDTEGNLWIGTVSGLTQLVDSDFYTLAVEQGLPGDIALCAYEDRAKNLWIGTTEGVTKVPQSGPIESYTPDNGLPGSMVFAIHQDSAGTLWFGIQGHGVAQLNRGKFERLTMKDGLICNNVRSFADATGGGLWAGSASGLSLIQDGKITNFTLHNGSAVEGITALTRARGGGLWVGTDQGTLHHLKEGAWTTFGPMFGTPAIPVDTIECIYEDKEGTLWLGSSAGLIRFRGGQSIAFTQKNGLISSNIHQVLEDDRERLWMASNRGVLVVSKADLNHVADGASERVTYRTYDTSDGMKSSECNGGGAPSGCRLKDGRLCFPTLVGLAIIDPTHGRQDTLAPPTAIEGIKADGEPLPLAKNLSLHAGVRRIELQYTALSFLAPERIAFRYKLLGYDKGWIDAGTHREAYYTNLPPGAYSFSVVACSRDGVWNASAPTLRFRVQPFFYQTKAFILLCVLAALGAAFAGNWLVVVQLRARNAVLRERTRIAREIHDTVAQGLTGVALQIDTAESLMTSRPLDAQGHMVRARELLGKSLDETRRAIRALRPHLLEQKNLPSALRSLGDSMTKGSSTQFSVKVKGHARPFRDRAAEEDLWKIAQEAIVNALRHGKCGHIEVSLDYSAKALRAGVRDDGPGFEPDSQAAGISHGLLGMKERAKERGWNLEITSAPGLGTTVLVTVPLFRRPLFWKL